MLAHLGLSIPAPREIEKIEIPYYLVAMMRIPLSNFEEIIGETILKRGLAYFKKGLVDPIEPIGPSDFETIVHGTDDYTVNFHLEKDTITDFTCDCPYEDGPVCKHMAAVIFYLQMEELMLDESRPKKKKKATTEPKIKSEKAQIQHLLDSLSHDTLKNYFKEYILKDKQQAMKFLIAFAGPSGGDSRELYAKQIKSVLKSAAGRQGYIDWNAVTKVGNEVYKLMNHAREHFENGRFRSTMYIGCAALEEMSKALDFADDSNGDIGGNIEFALQLLFDLANADLPDDIRISLYEFAIVKFREEAFSGLDWHLSMAELAALTAKQTHEADQVLALLDSVPISKYVKEEKEAIKLALIFKFKGTVEAEQYLLSHLSNRKFREMAMQKSFSSREYEMVKQLASDGIKQDLKDAPGIVGLWYDWLIKIAVAEKDKNKVIEYARIQYLDHGHDKTSYYKLLKQNVDHKAWQKFVEELIVLLQSNKKRRYVDELADIYIEEKYWDRLMNYLKSNAQIWGVDLHRLDEYSKYLVKDFKEDLAVLYEAGVQQWMAHASNRRGYQYGCNYLRKMKKLGMQEKVQKLITEFKTKYPKRLALVEELSKI